MLPYDALAALPRYDEPQDGAPEEVLPGGNVGGAVRVGGTVRRPAGPWTPAVHALLRHVRARGLDGVPEPWGVDAQGREVLSFLPGVVVDLAEVTDARLASGAAWVARYHAAVADHRPGPVRWRFVERDLAPGEIVCHHDATMYNMLVAQAGADEVVGVVDWDVAGPGVPLDDLAMLAWSGVPCYEDPGVHEGARRLTLLVGAYARQAATLGLPTPTAVDVAQHVVTRMASATDRIAAGQAAGDPGMLNLLRVGEPARTRAQLAAYRTRLPDLLAALADL
ncbi:aminoglycoside phosphotransferase [Cellulomonas flavigena DSM 20109]|uniref:Aminoglycoside phosphotransferase n=1 Tax=Cellulomonas flavigena (strain ATCC 482 / DSM 20109 / BCRC 11376 / JCM 18109 / NBRC 3775 / NCIMB 8073 / NRS 134) TaxID=446466 RepID=D5UKV1_CELFN|nr:phosphotransferase [Cellulomonas flavigena]ADG73919.1 aminoglycoside phosphotransferase [Cellulomonas flavigena DSM 20109]